MSTLITIDNGGTMTDVCVIDGDSVTYTKTLTTPHDLSRCLFDGLERVVGRLPNGDGLPGLLQRADYIRYSTTHGTNALVQRTGPKLGLLVDDPALRDRLSSSEPMYAVLVGDRAATIDLGVDDKALSSELVAACNRLTGQGASRLVVSISGTDGAEAEQRVLGLLLGIFPRQMLGAVPLLCSHALVGGDDDDVRRTWTSLLNAFLHPAMERFLYNAERRLREHRTRKPLLVFRNDGASSRVAKCAAIKTYSSGPRGGVEGTCALARHYDLAEVVMVDVGGTSTDVAVVHGGEVEVDRYGSIAGITTSLPLARITSHGIGGSSVFHVVDGQVTVGPDSVGAAPGPACFGLGGADATITDVLLLTGVLDSSTYLDGSMQLDADRSAAAVRATVADPLGVEMAEALSLMQVAYADQLADALRPVARRETTIIAFGGAGPMSICSAARRAGVGRVIIPRSAAVFSAFGIGFSDLGQTYGAVLGAGAGEVEAARLAQDLLVQATRDMYAEGVAMSQCELTWTSVDEATGRLSPLEDLDDAVSALCSGGRVQLEVAFVLPHPALSGPVTSKAAPLDSATSRSVAGLADAAGHVLQVPVVEVAGQPRGAVGDGPAVVEGPFFTMFVPVEWRIEVTGRGDLLLTDTSRSDARPGAARERARTA